MLFTPIDESLGKVHSMLQGTGLMKGVTRNNKRANFIYIFNFVWIATDIVGCIWWIYEGIRKNRPFIELTHVTPCLNIGMMAEFKTYFFVKNTEKIMKLLENFRKMEQKRFLKSSHVQEIINKETKFLYMVKNVSVTVNAILIVLFNSSPLIMTGIKYYMTKEVEFFLPFLDVYPVDCQDIRIWPFAYFHQIYTTCVVLTSILTVDYFFFLCCTHIRIQFRLLQHDLTHMISDTKVLTQSAELKQQLNDWVKWHQEVIRSANTLEELYSKSTLFNCLSSSLVICLTGFTITAVSDPAIVLTFTSIFTMGLFQIFFVCFFGDLLKISSTEISEAAYNSKWYNVDAMTAKDILTVQIRSQKPCKLTAAGFADVNLNAFMKILSSSWSYFALIRTMYSHMQQAN